ncbi:MAG: hypothetical protein IJQ20_03620 [Paludibacteraceae bacterium]|nr:hypothetical protein [Paludibacteraceae bacterium]MBQ6983996.1 hypothetical protein [Paludibacteraceae bacterium]
MMEENIRLELFTVQQVRDWLKTGLGERGLSEEVISRTRAWSIIHNPYVTDDLNIVSAIFVNNEVAAYTHLFPDESRGKRMYWNTTLYCNPKYEGRGYAAIVIGQFCELYGEHYFDLNAADASIANLMFCGLNVDFVPQYVLSGRAIKGNSIKAQLARLEERIEYARTNRKSDLMRDIRKADFRIKYAPFVSDAVYAFIQEHSTNDVFLRSQEMFNWILNYPLMQDSPIINRVERDSVFTSTKQETHIYGVEVYYDYDLVGFYILNKSANGIDVSYIYCNPGFEQKVFLSVAEHILYFNTPQVLLSNERLLQFLQGYMIYTKTSQIKKSFAYPQGFGYDASKEMQSGDGDNLT